MSSTLVPLLNMKKQLSMKYSMKDLGDAKSFIGIQIDRDRQAGTIRLHQTKYIEGILATFGMQDCNGLSIPLQVNQKLTAASSLSKQADSNGNPNHPLDATKTTQYQSIVGKLMYAMIATRPDLAYTVSTLGKFNSAPSEDHLSAAKRVLRYLKHTARIGIT